MSNFASGKSSTTGSGSTPGSSPTSPSTPTSTTPVSSSAAPHPAAGTPVTPTTPTTPATPTHLSATQAAIPATTIVTTSRPLSTPTSMVPNAPTVAAKKTRTATPAASPPTKAKVGETTYLATSVTGSTDPIPYEIRSIPKSNDSKASESDTSGSIRVAFRSTQDPYIPYTKARFFVVENEGRKLFVGAFDTDSGDVVVPMQIPLVGQSMLTLVSQINNFSSVVAQVINGKELVSSDELSASDPINGTDVWAYFFHKANIVVGKIGDNLARNLNFYFTTPEPNLEQKISSQSVGGFVSPNKIYTQDFLDHSVSFYSKTIVIESDSLKDFPYLQINDEIVKVKKWVDNTVYLEERQEFGTPIRFHPKGSVVKGLNKNDVFDTTMSSDHTQYRCIVLRNTSQSETAKDLKIYFKLASKNENSSTKISIEIPRSERYDGTTSQGTTTEFADKDLVETFVDGHFVTSPIFFTTGRNAGQIRIVTDYNSKTGTFILDSALPYNIDNGDNYYVDTSPSQRVKNGIITPNLTSSHGAAPFLISSFVEATFYVNAIGIDVDSDRENGNDLAPNETIYLWIERSLNKRSDIVEDNRLVLGINYSKI